MIDDKDPLLGKLINCEINGTDNVGIVIEVGTTFLTLQKCGLWESQRVYYIDKDVFININISHTSVSYIYEGFREMEKYKGE